MMYIFNFNHPDKLKVSLYVICAKGEGIDLKKPVKLNVPNAYYTHISGTRFLVSTDMFLPHTMPDKTLEDYL